VEQGLFNLFTAILGGNYVWSNRFNKPAVLVIATYDAKDNKQ